MPIFKMGKVQMVDEISEFQDTYRLAMRELKTDKNFIWPMEFRIEVSIYLFS